MEEKEAQEQGRPWYEDWEANNEVKRDDHG